MDKSRILENISNLLLENKIEEARTTIQNEYPHKHIELEKRSYTLKEKMEQFIRDGFIDRYTGTRLVNPGMLKVITYYVFLLLNLFSILKVSQIEWILLD